jgi:hypothetical protein
MISEVMPGSFGLLAHADSAFYPQEGGEGSEKSPPLPAATYEQDPDAWVDLDWHDRRSGEPVRPLTPAGRLDPEHFADAASGGAVVVETMGRVLGRYTAVQSTSRLARTGAQRGRTPLACCDVGRSMGTRTARC